MKKKMENNSVNRVNNKNITLSNLQYYDSKLKTYIDKRISEIPSELMQEVTYSELKNLRDNGELIPGLSYRITDYDCVTFQKNTRSAHNQFDVIVTADSSNALNENARAINHVFKSEGDTNVTYITLRFGSDHQLYFTYNGEKVWAFLYDEDDDNYVWSSQIGDVASKKEQGYTPLTIDYPYNDSNERPTTINVDGYNDMHMNITSVELRGQYTGKTTVIDDEEYYVFDLGKSNVAMSLEDMDYDGNPIYVERDKPFDIYKNLLYFKSLEPTIDDIYFYYNSSNFLPFSEYVDMWEQIYAEPLYFEYSVNNTVEPIVVDDYFAESNLSAWELKYALDDKENHYAWIHSVDGYGDGLEFSVGVNIGNNRRGAKASSDSNEETVTITASRVNDDDYYGRWNGCTFTELCEEWEYIYDERLADTQWYKYIVSYLKKKGFGPKKARLYGYKVNINDLPEDIHPSIFAPLKKKSDKELPNKEKAIEEKDGGDANRDESIKDDGSMITYEHDYCYTFLPPKEITSGLYTLSVDDIVWRFDAQNEYAITEVNKKGGNNNPFSKLNNTLHNLHRNDEQENNRKVNTKKNDRKLADRFTERMANKQKNDKPQHKLFSIFSNSQFKETCPLVNNTKSDRRDVDDSLAEADPSLTTFEFITDSIGDVIEEETFEYTETHADDNIRGVIYYMKDEFGNECPYDFKNIQFKRTFTYYAYHYGDNNIIDDITYDLNYYLDNYSIVTVITTDEDESYPYRLSYYDGDGEIYFYDFGQEFDEYFYAYTFSRIEAYDVEDEEATFDDLFDVFDATLKIFANYYEDDGYYENNVSNNIIKPCYYWSDYGEYKNYMLNNITFVSVYPELSCNNNVIDYNCCDINFGDESYDNKIGSGCYCNSFLNECSGVTLGNYCNYNLFGNEIENICFKNECSSNLIDNYCYNITLGNDCYENFFGQEACYITTGDGFRYNLMGSVYDIIFGHYCYYNQLYDYCDGNTFGNNCEYNVLGSRCENNTFGESCNYNSVEEDCCNNSFGNNCEYNTVNTYSSGNSFDNDCKYNTLGEACYENLFGNNCTYNSFYDGSECNSFGNGCTYISLQMDGETYNTFGNGCSNITFKYKTSHHNTFSCGCNGITCESRIINCTFNNCSNFSVNNEASNRTLTNYYFESGISPSSPQEFIVNDESNKIQKNVTWDGSSNIFVKDMSATDPISYINNVIGLKFDNYTIRMNSDGKLYVLDSLPVINGINVTDGSNGSKILTIDGQNLQEGDKYFWQFNNYEQDIMSYDTDTSTMLTLDNYIWNGRDNLQVQVSINNSYKSEFFELKTKALSYKLTPGTQEPSSAWITSNTITQKNVYDSLSGEGKFVIKNSVYQIVNNTIFPQNSLIEAVIPHGISTIGKIFEGQTNLISVSLPDTLRVIGDNTFYNCTSIENIPIQSEITNIGNNAFYSCIRLESTTIPSSVKSIGTSAFSNCTELDITVNLPNVTSIGNNAFYNCKKIKVDTLSVIPSASSFYGCLAINTVNIKLVNVPGQAYESGVVQSEAFKNCTALESVTIYTDYSFGNSLYIANYAFNGCTSLTTVKLDTPNKLMTFSESSFEHISGSTLYVNSRWLSNYQSASWATNTFTNISSL